MGKKVPPKEVLDEFLAGIVPGTTYYQQRYTAS